METTTVHTPTSGSNTKINSYKFTGFEIEKGADAKGLVLYEFAGETCRSVNLEWEDIERIIKAYQE